MTAIQNTINSMIPELYDALIDIGPTIDENAYKTMLIHMQTPDKVSFMNIPIQIHSIHNDHYLEIALKHIESKESVKIILESPWKDRDTMIARLTTFINKVMSYVLINGGDKDISRYSDMKQSNIIKVCCCATNYMVSYKPDLDGNYFRLHTWTTDLALQRSGCLVCNRYNTFYKKI